MILYMATKLPDPMVTVSFYPPQAIVMAIYSMGLVMVFIGVPRFMMTATTDFHGFIGSEMAITIVIEPTFAYMGFRFALLNNKT